MHTDARTLEDKALIQGDVCIVGAGAAGIAMALDWMGRRERVIVLEGGGFEYEPEIQQLYDGKTTGQRYYPLMSTRLHFFGGTTGHWSGLCTPFDGIDFTERDWVPESGWPISMKDLDPYYAAAQQTLKLGPYEYDLGYWEKEIPNLTPFPLDPEVFWNKMWQYSPARYGDLYRDAIVSARNIHLYTYANVTDIRLTESHTGVRELTVKNHAGKSCRVRAKKYVLACGTIQNARLLLASNSQLSGGVGNHYDLVGRYFMEHLEVASAELWFFKPFATDLYFQRFGQTLSNAEIAFTGQAQARHRMLNGTISLFPLPMGKYQKPRMEIWQSKDPRISKDSVSADWAEAREKAKTETGAIERAFQLNTRLEQAPNPYSRVTLAPEKDALGMPRAQLHWALSPLDKYSMRTLYQLLGNEFGRLGLGRVKLQPFLRDEHDDTFPDTTNGGWHHMGTTRMHENPKKGVVNADCQVHGLHNLYVAGAACFPTGGAANPTLTLTALSLRLSDHLKKGF
jgi:choline dehydrogenase-like flavoprotein